MTTTDTLTARRLYDTDATMRAFIASWDAERRCPMPLVDFLLEHGLEAAAEAARWANAKPKRPVRIPNRERGERDTPCGPYPTTCHDGWSFTAPMKDDDGWWADQVSGANVVQSESNQKTPADAIVWLLDNWRLPT